MTFPQFYFLFSIFFFVLSWPQISEGSTPYEFCKPSYPLYDVAIIGAGVSGISAATELFNNFGIRNIIMLEARDRIGGRVHTVRHKDGTFEDHGAQWVN